MDVAATELSINGVTYVPKTSVNQMAQDTNGMKYCIVRTYSAGVFAAYVKSTTPTVAGTEAILVNSRRLWYWSGAASLSQLSIDGVKNPNDCKFPEEVSEQKVLNVIEILPVTEKAKKNIASVPVWKY